MNKTLVLTPQQSKNINLLKGLSIVLVVFIHADVRSYLARYMEVGAAMDVYMETLNVDKNISRQCCADVLFCQWVPVLLA